LSTEPAGAAGEPTYWRGGWYRPARIIESSNRDARPPGALVELVVIHNISLPPGVFCGDAVERLFTNTLDVSTHPSYAQLAGLRVSAHFLVRRNGAVLQFVSCEERAWHAGVSSWRGREGCNDFSVGIEIEGSDDRPFTARQYHRVAGLLRRLVAAYPSIRGVAGHSEIAPGRKTDPGPNFDWSRLLRESGLDEIGAQLRAVESAGS
jgi:AmpD protein